MACPSLLRGTVLRATRLDQCGRPVYGDCNQVVSDGFITVNMSAETEEGEAISVTKANGQTCISEPGCEQLSHYTTEIQFCNIDPDLVSIMNPSYEIYRDIEGNAIGWDDSVELRCDVGFALELWTGVYASEDACTGAGSQGQWGYLLLPWVVGGASGDLEIGNAEVTFTFNGRTKVGSGWRRGPYAVEAGEGGVPVPMRKPIGAKVPRRFFTTTIRPPEAECGCQPVDRPTPDPADLYVVGVANESPRRTVRLRADNHGFGPVMVDWGDETTAQEVADGAWVTHVYDTDGQYTIQVCDKQTPVICATREVTIPLPPDEPTLTLSADNPDNRFEVTATIGLPSQADGTATVDWGDGSEPEEVTVGADGTVSVLHTYTYPSVYTVTVRRGDIDTYRTREAVRVPVADGPTASAAADTSDTTGMTTQLTWDNSGRGTVSIDWGDDGTQTGAETGTATHTYTAAGTYTVEVSSTADPLASTQVEVTVPYDVQPAPAVTAVPADSDATGRTAEITIEGFPADGAVSVDWGDGTAAEELPAGTTTGTHAYAAGVEGAQTITATSVSDATVTATTTFTPAPQPSAEATADAGDPMTADLTWSDFTGATSVTVDWGDGTAADTGLATTDGAGTAAHTYAAGTADTAQTITVTSEQDAAQTASATFTPTSPAALATRKRK